MTSLCEPTSEIAEILASYPASARERILEVRRLVFVIAAATPGVGPVAERVKWGEPAYLTEASKSGSTVRIAWKPGKPDRYAVCFNCNTGLVDGFRLRFGDELTFEGNRAISLKIADAVPTKPLSLCIAAALTYHLDKKKRVRS